MLLKWILFAVLLIHGLIHIIGTLTEFDLVEIEDFSGKTLISLTDNTKKVLGVVWAVVMIMFLVAAYGLYSDLYWWIPLTIASIIISQILVIIWWPDAKFGIVANLLILIGMYFHENKIN